MKQLFYIIFLLSSFGAVAQTTTDTVKTTPTEITQPAVIQTTTITPLPQGVVYKRPKRKSLHPTFKQENAEILGMYRQAFDKTKEIVLQNKRFRIYNNYITAGVGQCYNSGWNDWELSTAIDYNFHVKKNSFQIGTMLAGPSLRDNNVIQLHAGWGYRLERCNYHWAAYGGISYSDGYYLTGFSTDSIYKVKFSTIGVYANLQFYYKIKFDYGIGASAFIDANSKQTLTGIRIELFFSGAYRGLKKIDYAKEDAKY